MSALLSCAVRLASAFVLFAISAPELSAQASRTGVVKGTGSAAGTKPSSAAGFYTAIQATRGEKVFTAQCVTCHARKDMNSPDFQLKWNGRAVHDLIERLQKDAAWGQVNLAEVLDARRYIGRAPEQTEQFVRHVVEPIRERYRRELGQGVELKV